MPNDVADKKHQTEELFPVFGFQLPANSSQTKGSGLLLLRAEDETVLDPFPSPVWRVVVKISSPVINLDYREGVFLSEGQRMKQPNFCNATIRVARRQV